jgi:hypothetical protein
MRASGCVNAHGHRSCWSHLFAGAQMTKGGSGEQCDHQQQRYCLRLARRSERGTAIWGRLRAHTEGILEPLPRQPRSSASRQRWPMAGATAGAIAGPRRALAATGGAPVDDGSNIDDSRAKDRPCRVQFAALVPPDPRERPSEVRAEARGVAKGRIEDRFHVASRNVGRHEGKPASGSFG